MTPLTVEEILCRAVRRLRLFDCSLMAFTANGADRPGGDELAGLAEALREMADELEAIVENPAPDIPDLVKFWNWQPSARVSDAEPAGGAR